MFSNDHWEGHVGADEAQKNAVLQVVTPATFNTDWLPSGPKPQYSDGNLTVIGDAINRGKGGSEIKEVARNDEICEFARVIERLGGSLQMAFERLRKR
ncbi:MAG: hypothetical protein V2B20_17810 [Pseudomonadota bacterium]